MKLTPCVIHPMDRDEDCEHCETEFNQLQEYSVGLADECNLLADEIIKMGRQVDPLAALALRVDTFIQAVVQDPRQRARFEVMFLERSKEVLGMTKQEVQKKKLIHPTSTMNGLKRIK